MNNIYVRLMDDNLKEPFENNYEPILLAYSEYFRNYTVEFKCHGEPWIPVTKAVFSKEKDSKKFILEIKLSCTRTMYDGETLMITPNENCLKELGFK